MLKALNRNMIAINCSLQLAMCLNEQEETEERMEHLRYIEKVIENSRKIIKELEKCQDQK